MGLGIYRFGLGRLVFPSSANCLWLQNLQKEMPIYTRNPRLMPQTRNPQPPPNDVDSGLSSPSHVSLHPRIRNLFNKKNQPLNPKPDRNSLPKSSVPCWWQKWLVLSQDVEIAQAYPLRKLSVSALGPLGASGLQGLGFRGLGAAGLEFGTLWLQSVRTWGLALP